MHGICWSALILCLAFTLPAQEREHRVHDLRALLGPKPADRLRGKARGPGLVLPVELPLASVSAEAEHLDVVYSYPEPAIASSQLMDLLGKLLGDGEESELVDGRLHLLETPAVHERVRDFLGALEESVRPQLELEIHFFGGGVTATDVVLDAEATARLLRSHVPDSSYRCRITGDVPSRVRSATHQDFVRDYDVEVAQKAVMYDPKTDAIFEGLNAGVLAAPLADGRIHLTFAVQESEIERPIKVLKMRGKEQGNVHQPVMHSRTIAGSGIVPSGGALLVGAASERYGLCMVRVRRATPPVQVARAGRFQAVPLGDFGHPIPRFEGAGLPIRPGEEAATFMDAEIPGGDSWFAALEQIVGEPDPKFRWEVLANHLIVHRGVDEKDRMRAKLREWAAARRTVRMQVRAGRVTMADARRYLRGETERDAFVALVPELGSVAALPDRSFLVMQGCERKFVRDYDVEISQAAQAANPIMDTAFAGISFSGFLNPAPGGASLNGRFLLADMAFDKFDADMIRARDLDVLRSAFVEQKFTALRLRGDQWTVLLVQPTREKDYAVLAVRLAK